MTEPLVAAEVDLRDFAFMPLDVVRLRDSDLAGVASAEGFRAAVLLWCASWHQVPAGSLPNDERMLARFAGFGRDVKAWKAVREEALRHFEGCSDGRLYHPVIAEKANEAWTAKKERRERVAAAIAARQAKAEADRKKGDGGDGNNGRDNERHDQRNVKRHDQRNVHQGTGTVDSVRDRDRDRDREESIVGSLSASLSEPGKPARTQIKYPEDFEAFWKAYPTDANMSKSAAFTVWKRLSKADRELALKAVSGFIAYCREHPDYRPKHAQGWLSQRRFEGHAALGEKLSSRVFVQLGSPEWEAWREHRGSSLPTTKFNGSGEGWWCPSRYPPGHAQGPPGEQSLQAS